jgi:hypothetical protein
MREVNSNIWKHKLEDKWIIIATNGIVKRDGKNEMTEDGISIQVNFIYGDFSKKLGDLIKEKGNVPYCMKEYKIITLPVKNSKKEKPNIGMIESNIPKLIKIVDKLELEDVYMVQPGCGDDGMDWKKEVRPAIKKLLDDRFIVAIRKEKRKAKLKKQVALAVKERIENGLD